MHSGVAQADGARAAGQTVRREPIETVHPVVRVHPVTGWKSVYVNPGKSPPYRRLFFFAHLLYRIPETTDPPFPALPCRATLLV